MVTSPQLGCRATSARSNSCRHVKPLPFSVMDLREPLKLDYLWAGLCLVGAAYFMFRSRHG